MTHRPTAPTAARTGRRRGARVSRAVAVTLLATPAMLLAHLVTARAVPAPGMVALVALTVFGLTAVGAGDATGPGSRWRLALTVGVAQLAGQALLALPHPGPGTASVGGCLPIVGRGAELGLRLAFLQQDASCPQTGLAAGPTTTGTLAALLSAALVVLAHSLVAVVAAVLVTAGELAARAVRACITRVALRPSRIAVLVPAPRQVVAPPTGDRPLRSRFSPRPGLRRGPPWVPTAA